MDDGSRLGRRCGRARGFAQLAAAARGGRSVGEGGARLTGAGRDEGGVGESEGSHN